MKKNSCRLLGLSMIASIGAVSATPMSRAEAQTYSREQFERWQTELSNWGRWGKDDQIGVLNLITPEKRVQAMALAKKGVVVSMQRKSTLMKAPPVQAGTDEPQGVMFYEVRFRAIPPGDPEHNDGFSGEVQRLNPHGGYTHVDAICHDSDGKGHLYNGADLASSVSERGGCLKSGLDAWPNGAIVTRGILVDMTRLKAAHTPGRGCHGGGPGGVGEADRPSCFPGRRPVRPQSRSRPRGPSDSWRLRSLRPAVDEGQGRGADERLPFRGGGQLRRPGRWPPFGRPPVGAGVDGPATAGLA